MKNCLLAVLAVMPLLTAAQEPQYYTIHGTVSNMHEPNKAILLHTRPGHMVFDTVDVVNGSFTFTGVSTTPQRAHIYITHNSIMPANISMGDRVPVYLETGDIQVRAADSLKNAVISGTPFNDDQQALAVLLKPYEAAEEVLQRRYSNATKASDSLEAFAVQTGYKELKAEKDSLLFKYVAAHRQSVVSLYVIQVFFDPGAEHARAEALYDLLDPQLQNSAAGLSLTRKLQRAKVVDIGGVAPDFAATDKNGSDVKLASFRGKYVLLDFWASWCVPCRKENPNVVNAFNQFKDQNFTILSFSLDEGDSGKSSWLGAIEKDGMPWTQVSDLAGWSSPVAAMYNIKAIPANFLLDPEGKIIAKNLRGKDLEDKLAEIFKKS